MKNQISFDELRKIFDKLTTAQQQTIHKICTGYPVSILNALTLKKLHGKGLMQDQQLINLRAWGEYMGLTTDDMVDPVWVTLDNLSRAQLRVVAEAMDSPDLRPNGSSTVHHYLKRYGILEMGSKHRLVLADVVVWIWDDWIEANPEKVAWFSSEIKAKPRHLTVVRTKVDLSLLDNDNAMAYEYLLSPGQRDVVERFTLHPEPREEINRLTREYVKVCVGVRVVDSVVVGFS